MLILTLDPGEIITRSKNNHAHTILSNLLVLCLLFTKIVIKYAEAQDKILLEIYCGPSFV